MRLRRLFEVALDAFRNEHGRVGLGYDPRTGQGRQDLSVLPAATFGSPDWTAFYAQYQGAVETLRWDLYDIQVYPKAGLTQIVYFGNGRTATAGGLLTTNMIGAGSLPGGELQVVTSIHVVPIMGTPATTLASVTAINEWWNVLNQAYGVFTVGQKVYAETARLTKWPSTEGITGGLIATAVLWNNGTTDNRAIYVIDPPIVIPPMRPFNVTLYWPTLMAVTVAGELKVSLDGWGVRPVQ